MKAKGPLERVRAFVGLIQPIVEYVIVLAITGIVFTYTVFYITDRAVWTNALLGSFAMAGVLTTLLAQFASLEESKLKLDLLLAAKIGAQATFWFAICVAWWHTFLPAKAELPLHPIHWGITRGLWTFAMYLTALGARQLYCYSTGRELSIRPYRPW